MRRNRRSVPAADGADSIADVQPRVDGGRYGDVGDVQLADDLRGQAQAGSARPDRLRLGEAERQTAPATGLAELAELYGVTRQTVYLIAAEYCPAVVRTRTRT